MLSIVPPGARVCLLSISQIFLAGIFRYVYYIVDDALLSLDTDRNLMMNSLKYVTHSASWRTSLPSISQIFLARIFGTYIIADDALLSLDPVRNLTMPLPPQRNDVFHMSDRRCASSNKLPIVSLIGMNIPFTKTIILGF
jgi:hypothetical protein